MIDVGKILGAHGIKGEVKVISLSDNPRRFQKGSSLILAQSGAALTIANCRLQKEIMIISFKEISDRTAAEAISGSLLSVTEDMVPHAAAGSYYVFQLEGLVVETTAAEVLGILVEVQSGGAQDIYRIDRGDGCYLLLPALKQVVQKVDLEARKMTVNLLPGLMEACQYREN